MPVTKRTTKIVSYNEQEDDDDFVPIVDSSKRNRNTKSNDSSKTTTKQSSRKSDEKLFVSAPEEPLLIIQPVKVTPIVADNKEHTNSQASVSTDDMNMNESYLDHKSSRGNPSNIDEDLSPKNKRMKHVENDTNENGEEEEEEPSSGNKSLDETEESSKENEMPVVSSNDHNTSRTSSTGLSDLSTKRSSAPLGFPTSKITIPSPHAPRVGLSRKSATIKPLHPNFTSRLAHE